jgi:tRNA (cytidine/uridine-2'-O-)-methyltransferase
LIHVVLVHPEIHWNTGNAGRTCLATGATLHVDLRTWPSWDDFERALPSLGEPWFFSTKGKRLYWDAPLGEAENVVLVFGRETGGLPPELLERYAERMVSMPIASPLVRSLNLSTCVGIATYEVLRQRRARER